ncbi:hypothetical protein M422DRAFT_23204 [Sphaerobolus stellatus SS14]|nr:hypothetical protein M422DRAFT_23204 [Sphaerobolus stellatus SS14]
MMVFPDSSKSPGREGCLRIIDKLQLQNAEVFTRRASYDGKRNLIDPKPLKLLTNDREFYERMTDDATNPKVLRVKITNVAQVDPKSIYQIH